MADFAFRVTPEDLEKRADEFSALVHSIEAHFDRINTLSEKTRSYWRGEAGNACRAGYDSYRDDISFVIGGLKEHPVDLLKMAGIYRESEKTAKEISKSLKVDQIV